MDVVSVQLSQQGMKGGKFKYREAMERHNRAVVDPVKRETKQPIHLGLEKQFKDLRHHILAIYGLIDKDMKVHDIDYLVNRTTVDGVDMDSDGIILTGKLSKYNDKDLPLVTYNIVDGDDYDSFDELQAIVDTIKEEAVEYLKGTKKVENKEVILRYAQMAHKESEITEEMLDKLSSEQIEKMVVPLLEGKFGAFVMLRDDVSVDEKQEMEEVIETAEPVKTEFEVVDDADVVIPVTEPKKGRGRPKKETASVVTPNGDIVKEEVAASDDDNTPEF